MSPRVVNSPPRGPRTTENLNRLVTHWGKTISNAKSVRLGGVWWTEKSDEAVLHRDRTEGTLWCVNHPGGGTEVSDKRPTGTNGKSFWLDFSKMEMGSFGLTLVWRVDRICRRMKKSFSEGYPPLGEKGTPRLAQQQWPLRPVYTLETNHQQ